MRLLFVLLACCGRVGFEPVTRTTDGSTVVGDGSTVDALISTGVGCSQSPPFLYLVSPREEGSSGGYIEITWCSAGISGPLVATLLELDFTLHDGSAPAMEPVVNEKTTVSMGSQYCDQCFFRLEAGGLLYDGPVTVHSGD